MKECRYCGFTPAPEPVASADGLYVWCEMCDRHGPRRLTAAEAILAWDNDKIASDPSPTPWQWREYDDGVLVVEIYDARHNSIVESPKLSRGDARFIVGIVNAHDDLVTACSRGDGIMNGPDFLDYVAMALKNHDILPVTVEALQRKAKEERDALALAKGGSSDGRR